MSEISGKRRLSRKEAAEYLTNLGYRVAPTTLAKLASVGGGPLFTSFGRRPLYTPTDLLNWAQARSSGPRRSTSDRGERDPGTCDQEISD